MGSPEHGKLGLSVRSLTQQERNRADLAKDEGVIVERIAEGPASQVGIRPGDIILSLNGEKVASAEDLRRLVKKYGKQLLLHILRNDMKLFVAIRLE